MSGMGFVHSPALWAAIVLVGIFGLLGDTAWRSWRLPGQPIMGGPVFLARSVPVVTGDGHTLWSAGVQVDYTPLASPPVVLADWSPRGGDFLELAPAVPERTEAGATEDWSPIAEVAEAGRSLEDWLSERLQQFDEALRWIDQVPRRADGVGAFVLADGRSTAEELKAFVASSQRLHAYRELRIGQTGDYTTREHMELEALLGA